MGAKAMRSAHRESDMTAEEKDIIAAARTWWRGHRPVGWTLKEHLKNARVNVGSCVNWDLANAVAEYESKKRGRRT